ncbi:acyl-CoA thioesterase [Paenibacillus baekrokdamisoli]|uniref:Acyl-CoA thioesterase n=1 Tax=Paenibacillus baekrokdamisoli TaxID=1712516 RepID=A0A3G9JA98_9BACL|nr:acyl-CoA thioesterase [Paenibacillus baekrokdamisoli]MBB3070568.1 acyl-CoA hydrolase [Paenibacillus baekrokdamisoli]BBH19919.1 acyl-CoA thioesterase [Paenibacillus baekrokdamisoli]
MQEELESKSVSESRSTMVQLIFPSDTNYHGTMFGGKVMEYMDKIAAITSMRHARKPVVTASTDSLDFVSPIRVGEVIEVEAFVTWTHNSSMEIYVKVQTENVFTGDRKTAVTAFFSFVALDDAGKPSKVPGIIPETDEQKALHASAQSRYDLRMMRKRERQIDR